MPTNTTPDVIALGSPTADDALIRAAVSTIPLFANIADELLRTVAVNGQAVSIAGGEIIYRQGEPGGQLYCVLSGEIQIVKQLEDGTEVELRRARPGDSFGELALLDGGHRDATARALAPSQLFVLRRDDFLDAIPRTPKLLSTVLANLVQVTRTTTELALRQEREQEMRRTEMELEKYRALAQMIAGVAHEINTPIGIVRTAASVVKQRLALDTVSALEHPAVEPWSDIREAIDLIDANIQRADTLIRAFKQLSASHVADARETMSLIQVIEDVVGLFRINARQAKLTIDIHNLLAGAASDTWVGYRGFLTQVLLNLLTNVERYAYERESGGAVQIVIGEATDRRGERFCIIVRDWGRGMTAATAARIFEPFYTTGRGKGATGLGMSIVHNLMTSALKGTVEVAASDGAGTAVTLTFPKSIPE
jgi:signal transduction histidine kinase